MPNIGQLILLTNGTRLDASSGFLPCDGRVVKQSDYPALYSVIGTSWGHTTNDEFYLPSGIPLPPGLKSPASYYICSNGTDPSLPAPDAVWGRVDRFAFQPTLPLPNGWNRPASQQTIPSNYLPCDGSSLQISQNMVLFSLIVNNYGGDGQATFALPNVPTTPDFFWGMPHDGYCIVTSDAMYPRAPASGFGDEFVGQIVLMPIFHEDDESFHGLFPCNGALLPVVIVGEWAALFSVIGNSYGGDGQSTFALPKLSPPPGLEHHTYFIVTDGIYPASDDD